MNTFIKIMLLSISLLLVSCSDSQDKVVESTKMQSEISSKNQIEAENINLKLRAEEMEKDLSARHRFYQGVKGRYEGSFLARDTEYKIRITLNPNIAPYEFSEFRPHRRLEEIASDLNNLSFNAQVIQWNPKNNLSAVSCRVDLIRPDLRMGEIIISHSSCPNLYSIKISDDEKEWFDDATSHQALAKHILDGAEEKVELLVGEIQPSTSSDIYKFKAKR